MTVQFCEHGYITNECGVCNPDQPVVPVSPEMIEALKDLDRIMEAVETEDVAL